MGLYKLFAGRFGLTRRLEIRRSRQMNQHSGHFDPLMDKTIGPARARDWIKVLSSYREPSTWRSFYELGITLGPFIALWALAWWSLSVSAWLTLAISLCNGAFILRLFAIQHDCGHASFFKNRTLSDWVGRIIGVLTLTPYDAGLAMWIRSPLQNTRS